MCCGALNTPVHWPDALSSRFIAYPFRRCDSIRRDVLEDEYTRGTAFILEPETKEEDDDEVYADVRDSDERYEESSTTSMNATQKVPASAKKKNKMKKIEEPFFKNFVVMGS